MWLWQQYVYWLDSYLIISYTKELPDDQSPDLVQFFSICKEFGTISSSSRPSVHHRNRSRDYCDFQFGAPKAVSEAEYSKAYSAGSSVSFRKYGMIHPTLAICFLRSPWDDIWENCGKTFCLYHVLLLYPSFIELDSWFVSSFVIWCQFWMIRHDIFDRLESLIWDHPNWPIIE